MSCPDHIALPIITGSVGCPAALPPVSLDATSLQRLMPMHLVLSPDGRILRLGRSLRKLRPDGDLEGANFFDVFELRRPRGARSVSELQAVEGGRLSLHLRDQANGCFKGVVVPLSNSGEVLLNLSFGFSLVEAVRSFDLTAADFAGTDLAIEMLHLVEAKSAALQESKKLNQRLQGAMIAAEEQAFTDTLTGLKNRRAMDHVLTRLGTDGIPFGLLHLDLDYFKQVNDTHGHAAGDEVLQAVAKILVHETREKDIAARVGGDEFILIFQKLVDVMILSDIGDRIIRRLEVPIPYGDTRLRISGSIGITTSAHNPKADPENILETADLALYASKRAGRSRATVAPIGVGPAA
ncbi:GGDEF domain-containing protein [Aliiruegeria lutimaris]|uniref:Diguanylate cyclase (GGDEF) domain-containing protein n=1 Tax=Aliiruegeria lutimaris TaxID=571298 RepID=A0A1G8X3D0_9RHOB|nr:diguanylate cyclase [Aliiruegeria lutimaris]SDJ85148.1 diguanylate cyclase (GGDEF) domain-containing protein [Aliiruegeria lutimaris]